MKNLTTLALVSAMVMSSSAFAMESLDDSALSQTTGQDGVTIKLSGNIAFDYLAIHDNDGITGSGLTAAQSGITAPSAGAIVVGGWNGTASTPVTITAANGINLLIDADGNSNAGAPATGNAVLNINMDLGDTTIAVGSIGVAASANGGKTLTERKNVLDIGNVTLNGLKVNVQLGSQPQGALIKVNSVITNGLDLSNVALKGTAGDISLGAVNIKSAGQANLNLALSVNPVANGLTISGLGNLDVSASALKLGDTSLATTKSLGAMYVSNLSVGDMTISGH